MATNGPNSRPQSIPEPIAQSRGAGLRVQTCRRLLVGGIAFTLFLFLCEFSHVGFGHGQRHMFARLDHIELSWKQHHESTRMANATGDPSGLIAGPPVEIGARRSNDRRARILRNHQAAEG